MVSCGIHNKVPVTFEISDAFGTKNCLISCSDHVVIFGLSAIFGNVVSVVIPTAGVALIVACCGFPCILVGSITGGYRIEYYQMEAVAAFPIVGVS